MDITVKNLIANRVEFDDFIDALYDTGNPVDLHQVIFENLILTKDKPIDYPGRMSEPYVQEEDMITDGDLLVD